MNSLSYFFEKINKYGISFYFWVVLEKMHLAMPWRRLECKRKYYERLSLSEREEDLKKIFQAKEGYPLNLDNPQTFDEKVQWLKLYDSTPLKTQLADKYAVREWITDKIGDRYLIPLLGVWNNFDDIEFDKLPDRFVLKANHGSNMNIIVKDKNSLDIKKARRSISSWLKTSFGADESQEWHYKDIPHKIIAEKYLDDLEGKELSDYKVYCFNGEPKFIQVIADRHSDSRQIFMSLNWETLPFTSNANKLMQEAPIKPVQLDEMIKLSKKLAKDFIFVRIDWYLVGNEIIYFGEMTFTPSNGFMKWRPDGTDEYLGSMISLPKQ